MPKTIIASLALALTFLAIASTEMQAKPSQHIQFDRHNPHGYGQPIYVRTVGAKQIRKKRELRMKATRKARPNIFRSYAAKIAKSASLQHVTPRLAEKAREIIGACNAKVISAYRPGARVRGYGTPSLHSRYPAEAIDMTGDTSCIYPRLKNWAGGFSIDYAAVRHIHISLASDRRERGARFAHYGTRRYARR